MATVNGGVPQRSALGPPNRLERAETAQCKRRDAFRRMTSGGPTMQKCKRRGAPRRTRLDHAMKTCKQNLKPDVVASLAGQAQWLGHSRTGCNGAMQAAGCSQTNSVLGPAMQKCNRRGEPARRCKLPTSSTVTRAPHRAPSGGASDLSGSLANFRCTNHKCYTLLTQTCLHALDSVRVTSGEGARPKYHLQDHHAIRPPP